MRFHIGFSKFIKPKKLIELLGLLFIGSLAFFGIYNHEVLAATTYIDSSSYFSNYHDSGVRKTSASGDINDVYSNTIDTVTFTTTNSYTSESNSVFTFGSNGYNLVATRNYYRVLDNASINLNHSYCAYGSDKSVNLTFMFNSKSFQSVKDVLIDNNFNYVNDVSDLVAVYIEPIFSDSPTGPNTQYACHINDTFLNVNDSDYGNYQVECQRIPIQNVVGYKIYYYNELYRKFIDNINVLNFGITGQVYLINGIDKNVGYECSTQRPMSPNDTIFPEDAIGNSSVTGGIQDNITETFVKFNDLYVDLSDDLTIPELIENLIYLPFRLVSLLTNNDVDDICTPLTLNLSSITRRWGGFDYSISIPCMRTYITDLLDYNVFGNITIYVLADMFMAFGLTIWFAQKIWLFINHVISGRDISQWLLWRRS